MAKDPRFNPQITRNKTEETKKEDRTDRKIVGKELANNTILTDHLSNGIITTDKIANDSITSDKIAANAVGTSEIANSSITSGKLTSISIPQPFHCASHLSTTTSGWVRVAQLDNLSAVEFWLRVTVSGNHNMAKFVGTYSFLGGGFPQITFRMSCNARFGWGFSDIRIVYKGTYDRIYLEVFLPQSANISVGQSSAFGNTVSGFSNIVLEAGSIPSGYTSKSFTGIGGYDTYTATV